MRMRLVLRIAVFTLPIITLIFSAKFHVASTGSQSSRAQRFLLQTATEADTVPPHLLLRPPPPPPPPHSDSARPCEPLSARAVRETAEANAHGVTFVTFANAAQLDFALNWHQHLSLLGLGRSALLGATDEATNRGLSAAGARCFPLKSSIGADEAKWGSPGFSHMGRTKAPVSVASPHSSHLSSPPPRLISAYLGPAHLGSPRPTSPHLASSREPRVAPATQALLVRTLLELNATLLFADVDVVFLRDPLPYLGRQLAAHAQLLFHTDGFGSSPEATVSLPAPRHVLRPSQASPAATPTAPPLPHRPSPPSPRGSRRRPLASRPR